jgi:hypothetical protein
MFPLLPLFRRPFGRPTYFQYDDSTLPPRLKQFITAPSYKINTEQQESKLYYFCIIPRQHGKESPLTHHYFCISTAPSFEGNYTQFEGKSKGNRIITETKETPSWPDLAPSQNKGNFIISRSTISVLA